MAEAKRDRRRSSVTRLVSDVVDDTKDLVDDVLDRAGDLEERGRRSARRVVDEPRRSRRDRESAKPSEIDELNDAISDLAAKVSRLAALQADKGKGAS